MLPKFPEFKKLEFSDWKHVETITVRYAPYSDFNFVSMWSWDVHGKIMISQLHDNLVVRFTDYLTGDLFYSFLGNKKINETVENLIRLSEKERLTPCLRLVPEDSIKGLDVNRFAVQEDRNHFDYILDVQKAKDISGGKFSERRRQINCFIRNHKVSLKSHIEAPQVNNFLKELKKSLMAHKLSLEDKAIARFFGLKKQNNITSLGLFVDDEMIGFLLNESIHDKYSLGHFFKIKPKAHRGAAAFLVKNIAEILHATNHTFINIEQDLGIIGLRVWKSEHQPVFFLKKYAVRRAAGN